MSEDADRRLTHLPSRLCNSLIAPSPRLLTIGEMTSQEQYQSTAFYETYLALRDGEPVDEDQPIVFHRNDDSHIADPQRRPQVATAAQ